MVVERIMVGGQGLHHHDLTVRGAGRIGHVVIMEEGVDQETHRVAGAISGAVVVPIPVSAVVRNAE
jgi:hypothetical protein